MLESVALRRPHSLVCACVGKGHNMVFSTVCTPLKRLATCLFKMHKATNQTILLWSCEEPLKADIHGQKPCNNINQTIERPEKNKRKNNQCDFFMTYSWRKERTKNVPKKFLQIIGSTSVPDTRNYLNPKSLSRLSLCSQASPWQ